MKRNSLTLIVAAVCASLLFAACRSAPIRNVSDTAVNTNLQSITDDQVKKAIITAGSGLGWSMKESGPGLLVATLILRSHTAVVDIHYDTKKYNITYKSSVNLDYDGKEIHRNYNGWIQNLDNAIKNQLTHL